MTISLTIHFIVHHDYSYIYRALKSLSKTNLRHSTIYITINSGNSDEFTKLKNTFSDIRYIVNESPKGFAENHNHVLQITTTSYILLLNDDVEIRQNAIENMIEYLEENPTIGLVSPRIINPDETPQLTSFSYPTLPRMIYKISGLGHITRQGSSLRNFIINSGIAQLIGTASLTNNETTKLVPVVVGVAMLVRQEVFQQVGGMDEDTIVYGEEFAWQWRMKQANWDIAMLANAEIVHFNTGKDIRGWKLAEHRKGMLNFFCRYRPKWQAWILRVAIVFFHGLRCLFNLVFDRQRVEGDFLSMKMAFTWKPSETTSGTKYVKT